MSQIEHLIAFTNFHDTRLEHFIFSLPHQVNRQKSSDK
jgi:hypothetical protein